MKIIWLKYLFIPLTVEIETFDFENEKYYMFCVYIFGFKVFMKEIRNNKP